MSYHEWNYTMYGIELPNTIIMNGTLFDFINNHKDVLEEELECCLPTSPDDVWEFVDEYEGETGECGIHALIADIIGCEFIYATHDQYGNDYIGMYGLTMFPWYAAYQSISEWSKATPEYLASKICPVVEELYGECPALKEHTIWQQG